MTQRAPLDDPSTMDTTEVARVVGANLERGLDAVEASRRLASAGPNELRSAPPIAAWRRPDAS